MGESNGVQFLEQIVNILKEEGVLIPVDRSSLVVDFKQPSELERHVNLSLDASALNLRDLVDLCQKVIGSSVKTSHPYFFNQLYAGVDVFGVGGALISETMNTNQHTFEIAPVFTLIENTVLKHVRELFGIKNGDGIFAPGGSVSNMYAMVLARYKKFPDVKSRGLVGLPVMVCFTSEDSHYSIQKGAHWLGFGTDNVVLVQTDADGRMVPEVLEKCVLKCLEEGKMPLFLNATVGTTVFGSIDPLNELSRICHKYHIWLHVDACFGGTLMLSKTYGEKLSGIQKCDSFAWNPHKMLGAPLQCAIFITRHQNLLHLCNSASATYLFQQDKFYDVTFDTGDKSVQCGRKIDAFKLWVMWKARGNSGFQKLVDNTMSCASYLKKILSSRIGFRLVKNTFDITCICFWYIPTHMRNQKEDDAWKEELHKVAPKIKEKMVLAGSLMIGYTPMRSKGLVNFFRMVLTCQPPPTYADMEYVISEIEKLGEQIS